MRRTTTARRQSSLAYIRRAPGGSGCLEHEHDHAPRSRSRLLRAGSGCVRWSGRFFLRRVGLAAAPGPTRAGRTPAGLTTGAGRTTEAPDPTRAGPTAAGRTTEAPGPTAAGPMTAAATAAIPRALRCPGAPGAT